MKRHTQAFTLVELLVVIGIIALLITILMPGLRKAKEFANRIYCANNIAAIAKAAITYAGDWDGYPPPKVSHVIINGQPYKVDSEAPTFWIALDPYLGHDPPSFTDQAALEKEMWYGQNGCPSYRAGSWSQMAMFTAFCLNSHLQGRKIDNVKRPGQVVFVCDSAFATFNHTPIPGAVMHAARGAVDNNGKARVHPRHRAEGLNFGFMDAHVEFMGFQSLDYNPWGKFLPTNPYFTEPDK